MPTCNADACRVATGNRLTSKLLEAAEGGCDCSLRRVALIISKGSDKCTRRVIKMAFKFLDPEPLTRFTAENPWYSASNRLDSNRAMHSLSILNDIATEFESDPSLVSEELDSYVQSIDGICQWITHSLQREDINIGRSGEVEEGAAFAYWAGILAVTHDVHTRIARALLSSTTFCKLVIQMWAFKTSTGRFKTVLFPKSGCLILKLMQECLNDEAGRELLLRELTRLPHFAKTFAAVTIQRCLQIQEDCFNKSVPRSEALYYVCGVMDVILFSATHNELVERAFANRQYLKHLVSSMLSLSLGASRTDGTFEHLEIASRKLVVLGVDIPAHRVDYNFGEMIDGGFVEYIGRLLDLIPKRVDHDPDVLDRVERVVQALGAQTIHPHVTSRLQDVAVTVKGLARRSWNPRLKNACVGLYEKFREMDRIYGSLVRDGVHLCDNQKCGHQLRPQSSSPGSGSKKCSGCSTMIYCSVECQEDDWENMHKSECRSLRVEYFCRKARRHRYSPATRSYHVAYLECIFNRYKEEFKEGGKVGRGIRADGIPWYDITALLGFRVPPCRKGLRLDGSKQEEESEPPRPVPITNRLASTRDICLRPGAGEVRIVHASLSLGYFGIFLMVQLEKVEDRYEAIHSYFYTI
ncbi:hypothetical protein D9611_005477 [Ephemerocybe angulata]|uniref:MYND-type domain-containing protein n=1 Tax=Ephemerocybe angulata TaxID=980116 RepID=A0A8H5BZR3_9AGAR|nr:hypothetical protein D9611_005477 [Tulosesus angulatus]